MNAFPGIFCRGPSGASGEVREKGEGKVSAVDVHCCSTFLWELEVEQRAMVV